MPLRSEPVLDYDDEPGILSAIARPLARRPLDSLASAIAVAASLAIVINALAFQSGPHPAPIFGTVPKPVATLPPPPAPRAVPVARQIQPAVPVTTSAIPAQMPQEETPATVLATPAAEALVRSVQAELARLGRYDGAVDGLYGPKTEAAIRDWERATGRTPTGETSQKVLDALKASKAPQPSIATATPQASSATTPSKRILSIQQVLAEQGYGPLKLDGVLGESTKAAIFRFEVHRGLPPTGELSPRFIRELSAISGTPLE